MPSAIKGAVEEAMNADVVVFDIPDGVLVHATQGKCSLKFELKGKTVNCVDLQSPGGEGWLEAANKLVTDVLTPDFGVEEVIMAPMPDAVKTLLKYAPYVFMGDGKYRWKTK